MGLAEWLKRFRELHAGWKKGGLTAAERAEYMGGRDELARTLLAAQHVSTQAGQVARRSVRVARALQVDIELPEGSVRAMTLDLSAGGFAAILAKPPPSGTELRVTLRVPGGSPLVASAIAIEAKEGAGGGNARVGFRLVGLSEEETERIEVFVFDCVLATLSV